jgi:hypothetical protein
MSQFCKAFMWKSYNTRTIMWKDLRFHGETLVPVILGLPAKNWEGEGKAFAVTKCELSNMTLLSESIRLQIPTRQGCNGI